LTETASIPCPPRRRRSWPTVLGLIALAILLAVLAVYVARRALARDALVGWLKAQGVESQVAVQAIDPGGFSGAVRIGPAADPDFTAEVAEIRYDLLGFWTGDAFGARPTSIRLVRPTLKARLRDGRLSFGALDPLIRTLTHRPAQPLGPLPDVTVDGARLRLDSDYGRLTGRADLQVARGRLQRLDLATDPTTLQGPALTVVLEPGELHLAVRGDRMGVAGRVGLRALETSLASLQDADLELSGQVPYPDPRAPSIAGSSLLRLKAAARTGRYGQVRFQGASQTLDLSGRGAGWGDQLTWQGVASGGFTAQQVEAGQTRVRGLTLQARSPDLTWVRQDRDRVFGTLHLAPHLSALDQGALRLANLSASLEGPAAARIGDAEFALAGPVATQGAWTGLGLPDRADTPEAAALKRALAAFQLAAPRLTILASRDGLTLGLPAPLRIATASGGAGALQQAQGPLFDRHGGAFRLSLDGRGGLPKVDLAVDRYRLAPGGASGVARLDATASLGPVVDGRVRLTGPFRLDVDGLEVSADHCVDFSARRLAFGQNDVEAAIGQLCPIAAPTFALADGGWRARGEVRGLGAKVPFLEMAVAGASGPADLTSKGGDLGLTAEIHGARLEDLAAQPRFRPLTARGSARLKAGRWGAEFVLADPAGRAVATARLNHDGSSEAGGLALDTGPLVFAPGGLQPASLSPLASALGPPVRGAARFTGEVAWTPGGTTSGGRLVVDRLDFRSPGGDVVNLHGQMTFSGLAPLRAAPGQSFQADSIGAAATEATIRFGLDHEAVQVETAGLALGGGRVRLEPVSIPFASLGSWTAVLQVEEVQLSGLVAASSFADRLSLEAKLSGRMPLEVTKAGVRITKGELHAVEPGKLSIRREALSQVTQAGGTPTDPKAAAAPGAQSPYSDFVYQAMEHLAFSELSAQVDSQAGGRLGVVFHIKGEHQPPTPQQIRLSWREVLTRQINRQLPLPSGTKVDLTLDTSLNLDQLLADFASYQDLRGSGAVQPPEPTLPPDTRRPPP